MPNNKYTVFDICNEFGLTESFVKGLLADVAVSCCSLDEQEHWRKTLSKAEIWDILWKPNEKLFNLHYPNYKTSTVQTELLEKHATEMLKLLSEKRTCFQFANFHEYSLSAVRAELMRNRNRNKKGNSIPRANDWTEIREEEIGYLHRAVPKREDLCAKYKIKPEAIETLPDFLIGNYIEHIIKPPLATRYIYGRTPNDKLGKAGVGKEDKNIPPQGR